MGCIPLIGIVAFALAIGLLSTATGTSVEAIAATLFGLVIAIALIGYAIQQKDAQKRDAEGRRDCSDEAGNIAWQKTAGLSMSMEDREKHRLQATEMYRYYRRRGYPNPEALAAIRRAYDKAIDRKEREDILAITKSGTKKR